MVVRYPTMHEKDLPHRPLRLRMGSCRTSPPCPQSPSRPRLHPLREILNAIFYIVRSGCAWRLLPHDFPPWKTVHHYFRIWRLDGVGAAKYGAAPALAGTEGQKPAAQCWDGRLTVGQNDRGGRRSTRLRRWEEGSWQKASSVGGHGGTRAQGLWGPEDLQALKTVLSMPELAFAYPRERVASIH